MRVFQRIFGVNIINFTRWSGIVNKDGIDFLRAILKNVILIYIIKEMSKYENLRVSDLREIARSQRLKGWSRLRKDNLISFIIENENFTSDRATEVAMRMGNRTVKELRDLARIHGVKIR